MTRANTEAKAEKPGAVPEGSDQKSREYGSGVSGVTATDGEYWTEAGARLMEETVSRGNMMAAFRRVVSNKGAPGVDGMTVDQLEGYLKEHWPRIREELLDGTYMPQPVLKVEIPKPSGGETYVRDTYRGRPAHSAGAAPATDTALRTAFLRKLLRVSAR